MFGPHPPSIRCILSTRAPSTVPYVFVVFYVPYCIFIPGAIIPDFMFIAGTIYQMQYLKQRNLHFGDSSHANEGIFRWIRQELE